MKKRVLSLVLAFVLLIQILTICFSASAASKTPVWDKYSKNGSHAVATAEFKINGFNFTYKAWYPKDIKKLSKCPVLLYCNGTGSSYLKDPITGKFLTVAASYGFICVTNSDENCGTGKSMDAAMTKLLEFNNTKSSPFYKKVDASKVALAGHSQGATCTMNLSDPAQYSNAKYYKAIYACSLPTNALAASPAQNCPYDSTKVKVPTLLTAGSGFTDQGFICPIEKSLRPNFSNIKSDVYMARLDGVEHAESMQKTYPYMVAWILFRLNNNQTAAKAFIGAKPELKTNPKWIDFKVKLTKKECTLNKVKPAKKAFKAAWKKQAHVSGYKISYSTNSKFKKAKTVTVTTSTKGAKTVKKLKSKKKYYVRVRAYTKIGSKNYYSDWSSVKTVKTK
ncbi:MAG: fibronectin type III domain-containing protein [Eubacterium sp.]|nr:fibronectin type III domain-containing protein [Eubacterium sp.]